MPAAVSFPAQNYQWWHTIVWIQSSPFYVLVVEMQTRFSQRKLHREWMFCISALWSHTTTHRIPWGARSKVFSTSMWTQLVNSNKVSVICERVKSWSWTTCLRLPLRYEVQKLAALLSVILILPFLGKVSIIILQQVEQINSIPSTSQMTSAMNTNHY